MRGETDCLPQPITEIIHSLQIIQLLCTSLPLQEPFDAALAKWASHPVLTIGAGFKRHSTPHPGTLFLALPGQVWVLGALGGTQRAAKGTAWSFT